MFLLCHFAPFMRKSIQIWDHFFSLVFPKDSENLKSLDIGLREVGATRRLNEVNKEEKIRKKKTFFATAILNLFWDKNVHTWDQFSPLVFPKDSKSLKILDLRFPEVGAKRFLNGTSKVKKFSFKKIRKKLFLAGAILDNFLAKMFKSETTYFHYLKKWTDTRTHTQRDSKTDILTYKNHRPKGPMLWKVPKLSGRMPPIVFQPCSIILRYWEKSHQESRGEQYLNKSLNSEKLKEVKCLIKWFVHFTRSVTVNLKIIVTKNISKKIAVIALVKKRLS